jgi:hypothetical protein
MTRFHTPKYRLTKMLAEAGGKTVGDAIREAEARVDSLADDCLLSVDGSLGEIDRAFATLARGYDTAALTALYEASNSLVGIAAAAKLVALDRAAYSLCDLADRMGAAGVFDREALAVHVHALHLFRAHEASSGDFDATSVLIGLRRVRDKFVGHEAPVSQVRH